MNRISLKALIMSAFVILLVAMATTNFLGISALSGMNSQLNSIVDESAEKVKIAARIRQDLLAISRAEKNLILSQTQADMDGYATYIDQTEQQMQSKRQQLRDLVDVTGQQKLDAFGKIANNLILVGHQLLQIEFDLADFDAAIFKLVRRLGIEMGVV